MSLRASISDTRAHSYASVIPLMQDITTHHETTASLPPYAKHQAADYRRARRRMPCPPPIRPPRPTHPPLQRLSLCAPQTLHVRCRLAAKKRHGYAGAHAHHTPACGLAPGRPSPRHSETRAILYGESKLNAAGGSHSSRSTLLCTSVAPEQSLVGSWFPRPESDVSG